MSISLYGPFYMKEYTMKYKYRIKCPWCGRGEVLADQRENVTVSLMCSICKHLYLADFQNMRSIKYKEYKEWANANCTEIYSCPCQGCRGELRSDRKAHLMLSVKCGKRHPKGVSQYYTLDLFTGMTCFSAPVKK